MITNQEMVIFLMIQHLVGIIYTHLEFQLVLMDRNCKSYCEQNVNNHNVEAIMMLNSL